MSSNGQTPAQPEARIVKRYSNRKLYDTVESRYVTLPQIAELVRKGEDVRIIDNNTKEDLTSVTLAQILYEEERKQSSTLPLTTLKDLLNTARERVMSTLPPVARFMNRDAEKTDEAPPEEAPPEPPPAPEPVAAEEHAAAKEPGRVQQFFEGSRVAFDQWQHEADKRMKTFWEGINPTSQIQALQTEMRRLQQRVEALEARIEVLEEETSGRAPKPERPAPSGNAE
ncbi:MAG: polyhydroxyalkanoate synthesis regulator DNA-binding domain-containing protein [Polyangiales bacterium]